MGTQTGLGTPLRPLHGEGVSMGTWDGVRDPTVPPASGGGVYGDSRDPLVGGHPWGHGDKGTDPPVSPAWGRGTSMGTWGHGGHGVRDPAVPPAWGGGRLWGHQGPPGRKTSLGTRDGVRDPTVPPAWGGGVYGDTDGVRDPTVPPAWGGGVYGDMGTRDGVRDPTAPPAWGGGRLWGHGGTGLGTPLRPLRGGGGRLWGHGDSRGPPVGGHPWGHGDGVRDRASSVPCMG